MTSKIVTRKGTEITDPPIAKFLFNDTRMAVVWLVVRVLLGWQWLEAGLHKVTGAGWMDGGAALKGYWTNAVKIPETGRPPITYEWYRGFIQNLLDSGAYSWFAKVIALGETAIGIGLIIGAFVGIAAFFGAFMNWNFIMAGSTSSNPLLLAAAIFLVLAWKVAGYYGADRVLLQWLGTPWKAGQPKAQEEPQLAHAGTD